MTDKTGQHVLDFTATARRTDPIQSFMAADKKNNSNTLSTDRLRVLRAVYQHPGGTARQLDEWCRLKGKAHRRARELERIGLIRRDKSGGEMRLYITDKGKNYVQRRFDKSETL